MEIYCDCCVDKYPMQNHPQTRQHAKRKQIPPLSHRISFNVAIRLGTDVYIMMHRLQSEVPMEVTEPSRPPTPIRQ